MTCTDIIYYYICCQWTGELIFNISINIYVFKPKFKITMFSCQSKSLDKILTAKTNVIPLKTKASKMQKCDKYPLMFPLLE